MDLTGGFFGFEGALLHSLPKSGGAIAPPGPLVPTSLKKMKCIICVTLLLIWISILVINDKE